MQAKDTIRHAVAIGIIFILAQAASAQPSSEVCDDLGGATICVRFENLADPPQETIDFDFDFDDPDRPVVTLLRGSDESTTREWWVWSHDGAGNPAHIGGISATGAWNYEVSVRVNESADPGADDLGYVNLNPTGNHWSYLLPAFVAGDVTDDVFVKAYDDTGGGVAMWIDGDLANGADITFSYSAGIIIEGSVTDTLSRISGEIAIHDISIGGYFGGDIDIDLLWGGRIIIKTNVYDTAWIRIGDMKKLLITPSQMVFNETAGNFEGDLVLDNGIPEDQTVDIKGALTWVGSIDLNGAGVGGDLFIREAGAGTLTDGGSVTGTVTFDGATSPVFSGSATFASVGAAGAVVFGGLTGDLNVSGSVAGTITVNDDIGSTGDVNVTGALSGTIHADQDVAGTISVGGDASTGDVLVDGELTGDIDLDDDAGVINIDGGLVDVGRVLVGGRAKGGITLGMAICPSALVRVVGGLASAGFIDMHTDNTNCVGLGGTGGDIQIGNGGSFIFDPSAYILVSDHQNPPGGNWDGDITVNGCLIEDPGPDLEICVCGTGTGTTSISQPCIGIWAIPPAVCNDHCN